MKMTTSMTWKLGSDLFLRGLAQLHNEMFGPLRRNISFDNDSHGICLGYPRVRMMVLACNVLFWYHDLYYYLWVGFVISSNFFFNDQIFRQVNNMDFSSPLAFICQLLYILRKEVIFLVYFRELLHLKLQVSYSYCILQKLTQLEGYGVCICRLHVCICGIVSCRGTILRRNRPSGVSWNLGARLQARNRILHDANLEKWPILTNERR